MNNKLVYSMQSRSDLEHSASFPRALVAVFLAFGVYLVVPVIDLPFLGLSLSAPIFFAIALYCLIRPPEKWFYSYRRWIGLTILLGMGIALSSLGNGFIKGGAGFSSSDIISLIQYAYWLAVFIITIYLASYGNLVDRIVHWQAIGVVILAGLRWIDALAFGNVGAGTGLAFMSQNSYGLLFSTFSPTLLPKLLTSRGINRLAAFLAFLLLWSATLMNGSRGSWIASTVGLLAYTLFHFISNPRRTTTLFTILISVAIVLGLFFSLPEKINQAFDERYNTLSSLEEDKSFQIRLLMVQKGLLLFSESPLLGVGAGRFRLSSIELDIPRLLSYADQRHFDSLSAHNSYVAFLAETGLLGSIPFTTLLFVLAIRGGTAAVRLNRKGKSWALAAYVSFIAMSIHLYSVSSITNTATWFVYGLVGAIIIMDRSREGKE